MTTNTLTLKWRAPAGTVHAATDDYIEVPVEKVMISEPVAMSENVLVLREQLQAAIEARNEMSGLEVCLECWKSWMKSDDRDLSASRMKLAGGDDDEDDGEPVGYESDIYADQARADNLIGAATNAMIDSMTPRLRWAIYKKCGVSTVWNYPMCDYVSILEAAEADLEAKLQKNIATSHKFL